VTSRFVLIPRYEVFRGFIAWRVDHLYSLADILAIRHGRWILLCESGSGF
jgi:hypothetical protein